MTTLDLAENFEGGAAGEDITTANTTLDRVDPGAVFISDPAIGSLSAGPTPDNFPRLGYGPRTYPVTYPTLLAAWEALYQASFPDYDAFVTLVIEAYGSVEAGIEAGLLDSTATATLLSGGLSAWVPDDGNFLLLDLVTQDGTHISVLSQGAVFVVRMGGATETTGVDVPLEQWLRLSFTVNDEATLTVSVTAGGGSDLLTRALALDSVPVEFAGELVPPNPGLLVGSYFDDFHVTMRIDYDEPPPVVVIPPLPRRTAHPTRRFPREDGAAMSSGRRLYPPPRSARAFGAQQ